MTLAELVRKKRREKDLSQRALATKLGMSGPQFISNIEREVCFFADDKLEPLAKAIGVRPLVLRKLNLKKKLELFNERNS